MAANQPFVVKEPATDIALGNLVLNPSSYTAFLDNKRVDLSLLEFEVLAILAQNPNRILPYSALAEPLWQSSDRKHVRHLNVLVHRLRQKLIGSSPFVISTVRGRGYGLVRDSLGELPG